MVVWIFFSGDEAMVLMVFWEKSPIKIVRKKDCGDPSYCMVNFLIWRNYSVHGIMGGDKKPRVQVHLYQDTQISQGISPVDRYVQQKQKGAKPKDDDRQCDDQAFVA